jgi:cytoskeletal protein CcmA (bactofilin family)
MNHQLRQFSLLCAVVLFCLTLTATASSGKSAADHTQTGNDINVAPDEQAGELTCFGCSVRVRGHVLGDVTTFGGSVTLEEGGQIDGEVTTFVGSLRMEKGVQVKGDVTVFGGRIRRDPSATVGGEVTNFGGGIWVVIIFALPLVFLGLFIAFVVWIVRKLTQPTVPAAV